MQNRRNSARMTKSCISPCGEIQLFVVTVMGVGLFLMDLLLCGGGIFPMKSWDIVPRFRACFRSWDTYVESLGHCPNFLGVLVPPYFNMQQGDVFPHLLVNNQNTFPSLYQFSQPSRDISLCRMSKSNLSSDNIHTEKSAAIYLSFETCNLVYHSIQYFPKL